MGNFTFRIDDDTLDKMRKYGEVEWSEYFRQKALERLQDLQRHEPTKDDSFSWRKVGHKDGVITVNARLGDFGPTEWSLEILSNKLDKPLLVELGGMAILDRTIRGVADYFYHTALRRQGIDLTKTISRDAMADLWITIVKWARQQRTDLSGDVALVPSQPMKVYGSHNQSPFDDEVIPKLWSDIKKDEDQINVFFSNFWIGSYAHGNGTVFRLSSYLAKQFGVASAKSATRFIDFNPDNQKHEEEIRKLIAKADVIYLPDLSVRNVRSIFFENMDTPKR